MLHSGMIRSFKSKASRAFWEKGLTRGLIAEHAQKIEDILTVLDAAKVPEDMNLPGFHTHALRQDRKGEWSTTVRANWRITYKFEGGDAIQIDYEDYH